MRALLIGLALASACKAAHGGSDAGAALPAQLPAPAEAIFDAQDGLSPKWRDYGWAPRHIEKGAPLRIDLSRFGGWIVARVEPPAAMGGLRFRYRAPAGHRDFLEVRVDSTRDDVFPRLRIDASRRRDAGGGAFDVFLPMADLNPQGARFDRVVFRAYRSVGNQDVELDAIALTAAGPLPQRAVQSRAVALEADLGAPGHPISPLIYGIAYSPMHDARDRHQWQLGATARRWGGNPASRYNWQLGNAWNTGSDWFFRNVDYVGAPGFTYDAFLDDDLAHGVQSALTVPLLGWAAKDTRSYSFPVRHFGRQQQSAPEDPDMGNGVLPSGAPIDPAPPARTSVPMPPEAVGRWVEAIRARDRARGRSVHLYFLDNEPMLWSSTHRDVHPEPVGYDELLERTIAYATAVRRADPEAVIAGPSLWGWPAYFYSAKDAKAGFRAHPDRDAHGGEALLPWWIKKLREHREKTGVRLVDVVDVHFYPQSKLGMGQSGGTDAATAARRLRATRALWDPTYLDESWIADRIELLPRLKRWIAENDPGLGISIGEWNFGAEEHASGGLAVAETLGRLGEQGATAAFYWTYPEARSAAFFAFRAFRDFDGKGARFGGVSLPAKSADPSLSIFASRDGNKRAVLVLLNLDPAQAADATVSLRGCGAPASVRGFSFTRSEDGFQPTAASLRNGELRVRVAPYAIAVMELSL